jgi:hypothetical protein
MRKILLLALGASALLVTACNGGDPVSDCQSACETQRDMMCNGYTGDEDCEAQCANAQTDYDNAVMDAMTAGCSAEFDALYACGTGGDPCDTGRCSAETSAYTDCFVAFCTDNPTSPACM